MDDEGEDSIDQSETQFTAASSPNKYLVDASSGADQDVNAEFTSVLSKSQKKKMRKKANQAAQSERYNTRSKGDLI